MLIYYINGPADISVTCTVIVSLKMHEIVSSKEAAQNELEALSFILQTNKSMQRESYVYFTVAQLFRKFHGVQMRVNGESTFGQYDAMLTWCGPRG